MSETFKELQGTMFQYSALEEYCRQFDKDKTNRLPEKIHRDSTA